MNDKLIWYGILSIIAGILFFMANVSEFWLLAISFVIAGIIAVIIGNRD